MAAIKACASMPASATYGHPHRLDHVGGDENDDAGGQSGTATGRSISPPSVPSAASTPQEPSYWVSYSNTMAVEVEGSSIPTDPRASSLPQRFSTYEQQAPPSPPTTRRSPVPPSDLQDFHHAHRHNHQHPHHHHKHVDPDSLPIPHPTLVENFSATGGRKELLMARSNSSSQVTGGEGTSLDQNTLGTDNTDNDEDWVHDYILSSTVDRVNPTIKYKWLGCLLCTIFFALAGTDGRSYCLSTHESSSEDERSECKQIYWNKIIPPAAVALFCTGLALYEVSKPCKVSIHLVGLPAVVSLAAWVYALVQIMLLSHPRAGGLINDGSQSMKRWNYNVEWNGGTGEWSTVSSSEQGQYSLFFFQSPSLETSLYAINELGEIGANANLYHATWLSFFCAMNLAHQYLYPLFLLTCCRSYLFWKKQKLRKKFYFRHRERIKSWLTILVSCLIVWSSSTLIWKSVLKNECSYSYTIMKQWEEMQWQVADDDYDDQDDYLPSGRTDDDDQTDYEKALKMSILEIHPRICSSTEVAMIMGAGGALMALVTIVVHASSHRITLEGIPLQPTPALLKLETLLSFCMVLVYSYGSLFLTGGYQGGLAQNVGNLYYATWVSFIISVRVFVGCLEEIVTGDKDYITDIIPTSRKGLIKPIPQHLRTNAQADEIMTCASQEVVAPPRLGTALPVFTPKKKRQPQGPIEVLGDKGIKVYDPVPTQDQYPPQPSSTTSGQHYYKQQVDSDEEMMMSASEESASPNLPPTEIETKEEVDPEERKSDLKRWALICLFSALCHGSAYDAAEQYHYTEYGEFDQGSNTVGVFKVLYRDLSKSQKWTLTAPVIVMCFAGTVAFLHVKDLPYAIISRSVVGVLCAFTSFALCFSQIMIAQHSENSLSMNHVGEIVSANLYYFTWCSLVSSGVNFSLYVIRYFNLMGETMTFALWFAMWKIVLILMAAATHLMANIKTDCEILWSGGSLKNDDMDDFDYEDDEEEMDVTRSLCWRTKYAAETGVWITILSTLMMVLLGFGFRWHFEIGFAITVLQVFVFVFGAGAITSLGGPAETVGDLYYSTWMCFVVALLLAADYGKKIMAMREEKNQEEAGRDAELAASMHHHSLHHRQPPPLPQSAQCLASRSFPATPFVPMGPGVGPHQGLHKSATLI